MARCLGSVILAMAFRLRQGICEAFTVPPDTHYAALHETPPHRWMLNDSLVQLVKIVSLLAHLTIHQICWRVLSQLTRRVFIDFVVDVGRAFVGRGKSDGSESGLGMIACGPLVPSYSPVT